MGETAVSFLNIVVTFVVYALIVVNVILIVVLWTMSKAAFKELVTCTNGGGRWGRKIALVRQSHF